MHMKLNKFMHNLKVNPYFFLLKRSCKYTTYMRVRTRML